MVAIVSAAAVILLGLIMSLTDSPEVWVVVIGAVIMVAVLAAAL